MSRRFKVIQTEHLSPEAAAWLAERCELVVCPHDDPRFEEHLREADALIVRTYTIVDEAMLSRAPNLKAVGRAGVGLDNVDQAACAKRGVAVFNTPDANTQAVVEYVVALLADALRPRVRLTQAVGSKEWNELRATTSAKRQMNELTLGVLGLGRVGRRVAQVADAIGFNVLYNDILSPRPECEFASFVPLEELFSTCEVISIHIDGRPENARFVDAHLTSRMKEGVVFINTSRGFVVDASALAVFLRTHSKAMAMLDVHEPEPFGADYPLLGLPNAALLPHLASRTDTAMTNMSWVVRDVWGFLERSR